MSHLSDDPISNLFYRLFMSDRQSIENNGDHPGSILDFPLYMSHAETINIMPRLSKDTVKKIAKGATSGNIDDMLTLSMMYSVGLGVPESDAHGMSWANFALLASGPLGFEECCEQLESDLKRLPTDFSYPAVLDDIYASLIPKYKKVPVSGLPESSYLLSPLLAGLRMFLVYRIHKTKNRSYSYLYDVRIGGLDGERVSLDVANKLNIPNYIGSYGNKGKSKRLINPDYFGHVSELLDGPTNYFVVAGTLTVPTSMKPHVKAHLPSVKTVSDLFDYFVSSLANERKDIRDSPEFMETEDYIQQTKERIVRIKDGTERELLKEEFNDLRKKHKKAKRKKNYEEASDIRERADTVKRIAEKIASGKAIPALQSKIEKRKKSLEAMRDSNNDFRIAQYVNSPENFFRFIASDIYHGTKGNTTPVPIGQYIHRHLQSNGFDVANVNLFDDYTVLRTKGGQLSSKSYRRYVDKFADRMPDQKITGIVARPVEMGSVKKAQKLPVYIVTSE